MLSLIIIWDGQDNSVWLNIEACYVRHSTCSTEDILKLQLLENHEEYVLDSSSRELILNTWLYDTCHKNTWLYDTCHKNTWLYDTCHKNTWLYDTWHKNTWLYDTCEWPLFKAWVSFQHIIIKTVCLKPYAFLIIWFLD